MILAFESPLMARKRSTDAPGQACEVMSVPSLPSKSRDVLRRFAGWITEPRTQVPRLTGPRKQKTKYAGRARGFTLIELMVTLAVLAIALSVGVPTYQSLTARSGLSAASNDLLAALAMTRSEALKRDAIVSLQAVSAEPTDTLGAGYCIVVGNPGNCSGTLLRRFASLNSAINVVISGGVSSISFDGLGGLTNAGGGTRQVTLCRSGLTGRQINVVVAGRAKLSDFEGC